MKKLKKTLAKIQHPFPLFLYLEWLLLCISLLIEFRVGNIFARPPFMDAINIVNPSIIHLNLILFVIMGLRLPANKLLDKLTYIGLELLLMLSANFLAGRGIGVPPILSLILVIRSCLVFQFYGRLLVAGLSWIFFILSLNTSPVFIPEKRPIFNEENVQAIFLSFKLTSGILFIFVLVFVLLLINALVAERNSREKLAIAHEQLRQYSLRIEDQATLQERNRISREIHDSLGHSLTAISIQLENTLVYLESNLEKSKTFLLSARQLTASTLKEVRQSVEKLRSDPLQGKSLEIAVKNLLREFQSRANIIPDFYLDISQPLPQDLKQGIYRIIQEALTNISKHSSATEVAVNIQLTADSLYLRVDDNGTGFNPNQNTTGFGLQGMRERSAALGGQLQITSKPGSGCRIIAFFPLSRLDS